MEGCQEAMVIKRDRLHTHYPCFNFMVVLPKGEEPKPISTITIFSGEKEAEAAGWTRNGSDWICPVCSKAEGAFEKYLMDQAERHEFVIVKVDYHNGIRFPKIMVPTPEMRRAIDGDR